MRTPTTRKHRNGTLSGLLRQNALALLTILIVGNLFQLFVYYRTAQAHRVELREYFDELVGVRRRLTEQEQVLTEMEEKVAFQDEQLRMYADAISVDERVKAELSASLQDTEHELKSKIAQNNAVFYEMEERQGIIARQDKELSECSAKLTDLEKEIRRCEDSKVSIQSKHDEKTMEALREVKQLRGELSAEQAASAKVKEEVQFLRGKLRKHGLSINAPGGEQQQSASVSSLRAPGVAADIDVGAQQNAHRDSSGKEALQQKLKRQHEAKMRESALRREMENVPKEAAHVVGDDLSAASNNLAMPAADSSGSTKLSAAEQLRVEEEEVALKTVKGSAMGEAPQRHPSADELFDELKRRQNPGDCGMAQRAIVFSFESFGRYGFATALHHVSLALAYARETKRVLVLRDPDQWIYTNGGKMGTPGGCSHGFLCFFEDVSVCREKDVLSGVTLGKRQALNVNNEDDAVVFYTSSGATYNVVTKRGARYRTLWWRAHLMTYLLRPRPHIRDAVQSFREQRHWDESAFVVGVHVRRGDKHTEGYAPHRWDEYLEIAVGLLERRERADPAMRQRQSYLFLSTDSPEVVDEAKRTAPPKGFVVLHRKEERMDGAVHQLLTEGNADPLSEGRTALENILLLSLCDELIGTFSSSFFKLAYELRFARTGDDTAHSLDLSRWQA